jgi:hypothetical protein
MSGLNAITPPMNHCRANPALAKRLFLRSAIQGYTPAMANLGTIDFL